MSLQISYLCDEKLNPWSWKFFTRFALFIINHFSQSKNVFHLLFGRKRSGPAIFWVWSSTDTIEQKFSACLINVKTVNSFLTRNGILLKRQKVSKNFVECRIQSSLKNHWTIICRLFATKKMEKIADNFFRILEPFFSLLS